MTDGGITRIIDKTAEALEESGGKITKAISARLHGLGQATRKAADHFDKAEEDITDRVPVYMVDHDGNVKKLVDGNFVDAKDAEGNLASWAKNDKSGIGEILDEDGKTKTWSKGKYTLGKADRAHPDDLGSKSRVPVDSQRIDPDETELSRATAKARLANGDSDLGNYAAFRYTDAGKKHDFILVGQSKPYGAHSEQFAGIPFLEHGMSHNVTGVYTERSPCDRDYRNCGAWLNRYFRNPNLQVSHTFDYTKATKDVANQQLGHYLSGLFD